MIGIPVVTKTAPPVTVATRVTFGPGIVAPGLPAGLPSGLKKVDHEYPPCATRLMKMLGTIPAVSIAVKLYAGCN
jgi:hypothetical protein